jgi:hypothetical protein
MIEAKAAQFLRLGLPSEEDMDRIGYCQNYLYRKERYKLISEL